MHMILVGDTPQPLTASEVVAPRPTAAVEAQTAPTELRRPSHGRRRFAISWIAATLISAALVGLCFRAEVVAGDEATQLKQAAESSTAELRQSLQREYDRAEALATELAKARRDLETQVALSSKKGDEAAQFKQAAESATAELRQSLQREHDRAEALATELTQARRTMEQKPAGVEEKPAAKQSEGVAENSKPEDKPAETVPLPKRVEHELRGRALSPSCFYYRTYDPASGTYRSYDGRIRSCR
jgi:hypothetical protein